MSQPPSRLIRAPSRPGLNSTGNSSNGVSTNTISASSSTSSFGIRQSSSSHLKSSFHSQSSSTRSNSGSTSTEIRQDESGGIQMILRIKRKRGEEPVDALVIEQADRAKRRTSAIGSNTNAGGESKSKASGEPDQDHDQSREGADRSPAGSRGVFRLAETVPLKSFKDPSAAKQLHRRITALSLLNRGGHSALRGSSSPSPTASGSVSPSQATGTISAPAGRSLGLVSRESSVSQRSSREGSSSPLPPSAAPSLALAAARLRANASEIIDREKERSKIPGLASPISTRFRVVQKSGGEINRLRHSGSTGSLRRKLRSHAGSAKNRSSLGSVGSRLGPPEIKSAKQKSAEAVFGKIIDAVAESSDRRKIDPSKVLSRRRKRGADQTSDVRKGTEADGVDARFAEMLGEYLKLSNLPPPSDLDDIVSGKKKMEKREGMPAAATKEPISSSSSEGHSEDDEDSEDEYVYDVYYRDMLPSRTGPAGVGASDSGLQPAAVAGHGGKGLSSSMTLPQVQGGASVPAELPPVDPYSLSTTLGIPGVVAQLSGLQESDDEDALEADDDGAESYDEGEDEDSNDEGFYRNDYPEQELPDDEDEIYNGFGGGNSSDEDGEDSDPYGLSDGSF
ncbi:hypothetical protein IE53DRAFT_409221 [Violaceomyces palustris]|uniref:Uncharacterized protein n=1 Tax=Violaceomyces palustris TaxID=1673888 RepID=A0ACD0P3L3_9BASI|nr:hypothetical protein IE53DRAFT_409221 [Violaceomyces palustris]